MNNELVSIAMCTYNGERFLREQLDSLVNQTYQNFELIITDDKSTDSTIEIIREYQQVDNRIKLYQNEVNLGFVKNFEKAISLCKGEYIALADQDDIWKLEKLETFVVEIDNNILIYSDAEIIDKDSVQLNKQLIRPNGNLVKGKCNKAFLFYNCVSGNTMMFKKELVSYILPIPKEFSFHDIWIAFIASTVNKITYTEKPMIYYRRYDEQVTRSIEKEYTSFLNRFYQKKKKQLINVHTRLNDLKMLGKLDFLDTEVKYLIELLIKHMKTYQKNFFNIKLYLYLKKNIDEVFEIKIEKKRKKYAFKEAMKLKFRMLTMFSI